MSQFPSERVAYVTGAGSGIGRAVSLQFATEGIRRLVLVDLEKNGLDETVSVLESSFLGAKTISVIADISKESEVEHSIAVAVKTFGRIDHCVNAAGITGIRAPTADTPSEACDKVLGVNLKGTWLCQKYQIRQFLKQDMRQVSTGLPIETRGSIVNISSVMGLVAGSYIAPYNMSKHAILGLTKTDAIQYGDQGIRVNGVCPGATRTPIIPDSQISAVEAMVQTAPIKRLGFPEEIAYAVCFLSSDRASLMTGASVAVDGGWTCQ